MQRSIVPLFALLSACTCFMVALEHTPIVYASTLENRVEQRRLARLGTAAVRYTAHASKAHTLPTIYERVQARRMTRQRQVPSTPSIKSQVISGINMERAKRGIGALQYNQKLERAAQLHAQDMIDRNCFDHESPEGTRVEDRTKAAGYGLLSAQECHCVLRIFRGENIAKGQQTVQAVIHDWMESPSHREAMLLPHYNDVGVGIAGDIWVLNLGGIDINPSDL